MLMTMLMIGLVLLFFGTPIWVVIGAPSAFYILVSGLPDTLIAQRLFSGMNEYLFVAIPLFMLAGEVMNQCGLTERLISFAEKCLARVKGNLAMVNLATNVLMAGITGSALADASAIGSLLIPKMVERGYSRGFAAAITASGAIVGPMLPPSITFILFAVLSGASVIDLFLAGILPGLLIIALQMGVVQWMAARGNLPENVRRPLEPMAPIARAALPVLVLPVLIVGGIRAGVFTTIEGAGIAVLYILLISLLLRRLNLRVITESALRVSQSLGEILLMIGTSGLLSWILVAEEVPDAIASHILAIAHRPWEILLFINLLLLLVGTVLENFPAMIILTPILLPLAKAAGVDPVQLGVIVNVNLMIGTIHPPVGIVLFVTSRIAKVRLEYSSLAVLPLLGSALLALLLITFVPALSLTLPHLFQN